MAKGLIEREKEIVRREKELIERETECLKKGSEQFHKRHPLVFAVLVVFSVIAFWRGTWGLMDLYFFPNDPLTSNVLTLALGLAVLCFTGYISKA